MNPSPKDIFNRAELLLGADVMERLASVRVILFGVGGVGSWCAEGLVRSGVKHLTIVDADDVVPSNINRQRMATVSTVGRSKVDALKEILLDINPDAVIEGVHARFSEETAASFGLENYDYIIDAIDALKDKASLILHATATPATFFSSMGAACKIDPTTTLQRCGWPLSGRFAAVLSAPCSARNSARPAPFPPRISSASTTKNSSRTAAKKPPSPKT